MLFKWNYLVLYLLYSYSKNKFIYFLIKQVLIFILLSFFFHNQKLKTFKL